MIPVEPMGCRWCGVESRTHYSRWDPGNGFHTYTTPTRDQIGTRMFARRRWAVYKRRGAWCATSPRQRGRLTRYTWRYATWAEAMHRATVTGMSDTYTRGA